MTMAAPKMGVNAGPAKGSISSVSHCIIVASCDGNMNPGQSSKPRWLVSSYVVALMLFRLSASDRSPETLTWVE